MTNDSFTTSVSRKGRVFTLSYPCLSPSECSSYSFSLPIGIYHIEVYGASGGRSKKSTTLRDSVGTGCSSQETVSLHQGNTVCDPTNSAGSGGYISGILSVTHPSHFFAHIGGQGEYKVGGSSRGGYNGGGDSFTTSTGCSSGGGATDLRVGVDDLYHRIIVGGGGGGTDDLYGEVGSTNDGSGGAGGYPEGQCFWVRGVYEEEPFASQLFGFTFGQGESGGNKTQHINSSSFESTNELGGAGGGWYGGFISRSQDGGAGGGSSFILTHNSSIPSGDIVRHNSRYVEIESKPYAFVNQYQYYFSNVSYANGIWSGNGLIRIRVLYPTFFPSVYQCHTVVNHQLFIILLSFLMCNK